MATWKCVICSWDNAEKWEKCAKCGTTHKDAQVFEQLRVEVKKLKVEQNKYQATITQKWEYLQISSDKIQIPNGLTNLGFQGWELVSMTSYSEGGGMTLNGVGGSSYTIKFMYIFKRPVAAMPDDLLEKFQDVLNRTPSHLRERLKTLENF